MYRLCGEPHCCPLFKSETKKVYFSHQIFKRYRLKYKLSWRKQSFLCIQNHQVINNQKLTAKGMVNMQKGPTMVFRLNREIVKRYPSIFNFFRACPAFSQYLLSLFSIFRSQKLWPRKRVPFVLFRNRLLKLVKTWYDYVNIR